MKDFESTEFVGQGLKSDSCIGINFICEYRVAFVCIECLFEGFLIDTTVDREEAYQECFFARVNTLGKESGLIGFAGTTECIVIVGDNFTPECSVVDNGSM